MTKAKPRTRRLHTPEFNSEAVKLVSGQGLTLAGTARDLGVLRPPLSEAAYLAPANAPSRPRSRPPARPRTDGPQT